MEGMTIDPRTKSVLTARGAEHSHPDMEYDLLSDTTVDDGTRTIVMKPKDRSEQIGKIMEIVDVILEKLGESDSKTLRALMIDALNSYTDKAIDRMYQKVVKKSMPIKAREGCFKIIIGDGRRNNHEEIALRD